MFENRVEILIFKLHFYNSIEILKMYNSDINHYITEIKKNCVKSLSILSHSIRETTVPRKTIQSSYKNADC